MSGKQYIPLDTYCIKFCIERMLSRRGKSHCRMCNAYSEAHPEEELYRPAQMIELKWSSYP